MKNRKFIYALFVSLMLVTFGNSMQAQKGFEQERVAEATIELKQADPEINRFFQSSYGYVVFPSIGKGAIGIGGAHGKGLVYRNGVLQGGSKMTQVTLGFQFGGKSYSEVIFFENADAYQRFINNEFQFAAQASAVALKSGASADAKYTNGVAVFTMANGGLMYEASVGGQKFKFVPANKL